MNYTVSQILYLLSHKSMKVFPVQVVEEVVRNTLNGREVSYTIMMPNKEGTLTELSSVNAEVFDNIKELKDFMTNNAIMTIESIVKSACELETRFNQNVKQSVEIVSKEKSSSKSLEAKNIVQKKKKEGTIKVDVGNGIKANINVEDLAKLDLIR
jgi:hypothetical protein